MAAAEKAIADRIRGACWGACIGDALAMPAHWYYGGSSQVTRDYGEIKGYVKPVYDLGGSIMNLSNTGGAGRGSDKESIIGDVINHGKKKHWVSGQGVHYHCTLEAGENTLEVQLLRQLLRTIAADAGEFKAETFRERYAEFMTTPGSHNDCYASTCHRMFFANRQKGVALDKCPDNDQHNVDTIDGLVLPVGVALAMGTSSESDACVGVTRRSSQLEQYSNTLVRMLQEVVGGGSLSEAVSRAAEKSGVSPSHFRSARTPVTA